jgi:hypothetical protein
MQAPLDTDSPRPMQPAPAGKPPALPQAAPGALGHGRERFIPVNRYDLRTRLAAMLTEAGGDPQAWAHALDCLAAWRHQEYRHRLSTLLENYLLFSPDADTITLRKLDEEARAKAHRALLEGVETFLVQANYVKLTEADIQRLLTEQSPYGLNLDVDLSDFDDLLLYYRGTAVETRSERNPWRFYRKEQHKLPIFQRLFLLLKLKPIETRADEIAKQTGVTREQALRMARKRRKNLPIGVSSNCIYLKVFKRIPQIDLEMLFPNTKIAFKPFDKLKLAVTAGGGTVAGVAGSATKLLAITNPFTVAVGLASLSAVIFRQVNKVFHTRNNYMMVLAQNLYFHALANNHAALTLIADGAEEEDVKEDMVLYAFLAKHPLQYDALAEIKAEIETFFTERCGVTVNFDAEDACRRLLADGLIRNDASGNLDAIAPAEARAHLDKMWDRLLDTDTLAKASQALKA